MDAPVHDCTAGRSFLIDQQPCNMRPRD